MTSTHKLNIDCNWIVSISEMLGRARGHYTEAQINRCSKMGGGFGREMGRLFTAAMYNPPDAAYQRQESRKNRYDDDIALFVEEYQPEALFDFLPPRGHQSFDSFTDNSSNIKNPEKLGKHLVSLSHDLDFWRDRIQHARRPAEDQDDI